MSHAVRTRQLIGLFVRVLRPASAYHATTTLTLLHQVAHRVQFADPGRPNHAMPEGEASEGSKTDCSHDSGYLRLLIEQEQPRWVTLFVTLEQVEHETDQTSAPEKYFRLRFYEPSNKLPRVTHPYQAGAGCASSGRSSSPNTQAPDMDESHAHAEQHHINNNTDVEYAASVDLHQGEGFVSECRDALHASTVVWASLDPLRVKHLKSQADELLTEYLTSVQATRGRSLTATAQSKAPDTDVTELVDKLRAMLRAPTTNPHEHGDVQSSDMMTRPITLLNTGVLVFLLAPCEICPICSGASCSGCALASLEDLSAVVGAIMAGNSDSVDETLRDRSPGHVKATTQPNPGCMCPSHVYDVSHDAGSGPSAMTDMALSLARVGSHDRFSNGGARISELSARSVTEMKEVGGILSTPASGLAKDDSPFGHIHAMQPDVASADKDFEGHELPNPGENIEDFIAELYSALPLAATRVDSDLPSVIPPSISNNPELRHSQLPPKAVAVAGAPIGDTEVQQGQGRSRAQSSASDGTPFVGCEANSNDDKPHVLDHPSGSKTRARASSEDPSQPEETSLSAFRSPHGASSAGNSMTSSNGAALALRSPTRQSPATKSLQTKVLTSNYDPAVAAALVTSTGEASMSGFNNTTTGHTTASATNVTSVLSPSTSSSLNSPTGLPPSSQGTPSGIAATYRSIFQLDTDEDLVLHQVCQLTSVAIPARGRLYISPNYICFYSKLPVTHFIRIRITDIVAIELVVSAISTTLRIRAQSWKSLSAKGTLQKEPSSLFDFSANGGKERQELLATLYHFLPDRVFQGDEIRSALRHILGPARPVREGLEAVQPSSTEASVETKDHISPDLEDAAHAEPSSKSHSQRRKRRTVKHPVIDYTASLEAYYSSVPNFQFPASDTSLVPKLSEESYTPPVPTPATIPSTDATVKHDCEIPLSTLQIWHYFLSDYALFSTPKFYQTQNCNEISLTPWKPISLPAPGKEKDGPQLLKPNPKTVSTTPHTALGSSLVTIPGRQRVSTIPFLSCEGALCAFTRELHMNTPLDALGAPPRTNHRRIQRLIVWEVAPESTLHPPAPDANVQLRKQERRFRIVLDSAVVAPEAPYSSAYYIIDRWEFIDLPVLEQPAKESGLIAAGVPYARDVVSPTSPWSSDANEYAFLVGNLSGANQASFPYLDATKLPLPPSTRWTSARFYVGTHMREIPWSLRPFLSLLYSRAKLDGGKQFEAWFRFVQASILSLLSTPSISNFLETVHAKSENAVTDLAGLPTPRYLENDRFRPDPQVQLSQPSLLCAVETKAESKVTHWMPVIAVTAGTPESEEEDTMTDADAAGNEDGPSVGRSFQQLNQRLAKCAKIAEMARSNTFGVSPEPSDESKLAQSYSKVQSVLAPYFEHAACLLSPFLGLETNGEVKNTISLRKALGAMSIAATLLLALAFTTAIANYSNPLSATGYLIINALVVVLVLTCTKEFISVAQSQDLRLAIIEAQLEVFISDESSEGSESNISLEADDSAKSTSPENPVRK